MKLELDDTRKDTFHGPACFILFIAVLVLSFLCPCPSVTADTGNLLTISTENGLSMTVSEDGRSAGLVVAGNSLPLVPAPLLWIRDMSGAGQVEEPNLLSNPGFEENLAGWTPVTLMDTQMSVTASSARSGTSSLQMHGTDKSRLGLAAVAADPIPVEPGMTYRVSGFFRASRGYLQGVPGLPTLSQDRMWKGQLTANGIYIRWLDAVGKDLSEKAVLVAPVHCNAHSWRKVGGEVHAPEGAASMVVLIVGRLQDETLWADDFCVVQSPESDLAVAGTVTKEEERLVQTAQTADGLTITAEYSAGPEAIAIHVMVADDSGKPRALEVSWALPLALAGTDGESSWRWWDDVHHSRVITPGPAAIPPAPTPLPEALSWQYENVVSGVWDGWLPVSLYPYAVVENGGTGLALAVSLDSPRLVKLSYDQVQGRFQARCYLGISPEAPKLHGTADFSLELYPIDPQWPMRSAMRLYQRRHSAWFSSPRDVYSFSGYERGFYTRFITAARVRRLDRQDIFSAQYTVADAPVDVCPSADPIPAYDDLLAATAALPDNESQAIARSVAYGANGDLQLKHVGVFDWNPNWWQAIWFTSVDPDIAGGWGRYLWKTDIERAINLTTLFRASLDGIMMDNFLSVPGIDLRSQHLALADTPLAYDVNSYRPGIHNMANIHKYFLWLRQELKQKGRDDMALAINFWGIATPNALAPLVDVFGGEGQSRTDSGANWNTRILDYRRAVAFKKAMSWTNGEKNLDLEDVKSYVARALFYGIFATRKREATGWEDGADDLLTHAQELFSIFAPAGWEPVTYARSDNEWVWIERFGRNESDYGLFFTLYNRSDQARSAAIDVETVPLGIKNPASSSVTDVDSGEHIAFDVSGDNHIRFSLNLSPHKTRIVRIEDGPSADPATRRPNQ